jgi:hypothetical protein
MPTMELKQAEEQSLEAAVNEDIQRFDEWFKAKGNDPLVRSEIAILKTFVWYKLKAEQPRG